MISAFSSGGWDHFLKESTKYSLRADVSISFASHGKGRLRNAVPNRVPVSCCSGFEFHINYGVVVFVARPLNCNFYQGFKTIFPSDRSKITGLTGEMGTVVTG